MENVSRGHGFKLPEVLAKPLSQTKKWGMVYFHFIIKIFRI